MSHIGADNVTPFPLAKVIAAYQAGLKAWGSRCLPCEDEDGVCPAHATAAHAVKAARAGDWEGAIEAARDAAADELDRDGPPVWASFPGIVTEAASLAWRGETQPKRRKAP